MQTEQARDIREHSAESRAAGAQWIKVGIELQSGLRAGSGSGFTNRY
jgi:hypothetical protein